MFEEECACRDEWPDGQRGNISLSYWGFIPRVLTAVGCRFMGK